MTTPNCHHVTLAQNGLVLVQRCTECAGITLHVGPVSVRLDEKALGALESVLSEATTRLAALDVWPKRDGPRGLA